jgi:hypothetical protein
MDDGFTRLMDRGIDVIELSAGGATDQEMTALADAEDDLELEEKVAGYERQMRGAGLLW